MISDWCTRLNVRIVRCEDRPDKPAGDTVYRVVDLFTTRDGSWEGKNQSVPGATPSWARDKYLRPLNAPDYFDDGGADHHIFARVLDLNGQPVTSDGLIRFWSEGIEKLGDPSYHGFLSMTPKPKSGWANQPVFNHFNPDRHESGAWAWCPQGAADVVVGGGLPNNQHVSFFAVWQAQPRGSSPATTSPATSKPSTTTPTTSTPTTSTPVTPKPGPSTGLGEDDALLLAMRQAAWGQAQVNFNRTSSFAQYARQHNLGAPLTNEFDIEGYRAQGFALAIVYARIGDWDNITHSAW
jgi:hypothetical protein